MFGKALFAHLSDNHPHVLRLAASLAPSPVVPLLDFNCPLPRLLDQIIQDAELIVAPLLDHATLASGRLCSS